MKHNSANITNSEVQGQPAYLLPVPLPTELLDIFTLVLGRSDKAAYLLSELLRGRLDSELPTDLRNGRRLQEMHFEHRNRQRLYGGHWLYFGYPLLVFRLDDQVRLCPLWLWPLELTPPRSQDNGWKLSSSAANHVRPNPVVDRLLRRHFQWTKALPWSGRKRNPTVVTAATVSHLVNDLVHHIGIDSSSQSVSIAPWPEPSDINDLAGDGSVLWSGVIGLFPPGAVQARKATDNAATDGSDSNGQDHPFGLLMRDPWQETALQLAHRSRRTLIQAESPGNKGYWLTDFLLNALSNGRRCLVVSERRASLLDLQKRLSEAGLADLTLLWQQGAEEDQLFFRRLSKLTNARTKEHFAENIWRESTQSLRSRQRELQAAYRAANKRIFGNFTWSQTVGLYLSAARIESKALLSSQLNAQEFDLTYDQYQRLREMIAHSRTLYDKLGTLTHPLNALNVGIFLHKDREAARAFIEEQIQVFSERASKLQYRYILEQNDYADRLIEHYEYFYQEVDQQIRSTLEHINRYQQLYGKDPLQSKRATLQLYAYVSEKFRRTLAAKEDIAARYQAIAARLNDQPYVAHEFLPSGERHWLYKLRANLEALRKRLSEWRDQLGQIVQEEIVRLNAQTVRRDLPGHQGILQLEEQLDIWLAELNETGLLQLPLENKNLTVPRRQRFLEEIMEKLEALQYNLRDFDRFYDWQKYWFGLPGEARRIIAALVKVKPDDWAAAFSSWFLHHRLSRSADPALPEQLPEMEAFVEELQRWQQVLIPQIQHHWAGRRRETWRLLKKNNKAQYDQLIKDQTANPRLTGKWQAVMSECFPLTLATPASLSWLDDSAILYDWVVIDEAHTLSPDHWAALSSWGKRVLMVANPELSPERLSGWVRRQGMQIARLPADSYDAGQSPRVYQERVDGRYDARQQINDEEARHLLTLLNLVEATPQRTLPSVAIICLTRGQRNLVFQYLERIKKQRLAGVEKIMQLERNGLGVYCPDELYGITADVVFLSVTFGPTGIADQLTPDITRLSQWYGPGMVSLLRNCARQQIHVLHSLPEEEGVRAPQASGQDNHIALKKWLCELDQQSEDGASAEQQLTDIHPLADAIAWHIADRIRTERLNFQVPTPAWKLPLCIDTPENGKPLALLFNGYLAETPVTNFEWESAQQHKLQQLGYRLLPIWTLRWWRRPRQESQKLLEQINPQGIQQEEE